MNISKTIQMVKSHDISENDYSTTQALFLSKELYWVARCDFLQKFRQSQLDTFVRVAFDILGKTCKKKSRQLMKGQV